MKNVLAFDVYGTLIDTHGVLSQLETLITDNENALLFSNTWRLKQLEYSFRRGLMGSYEHFSVCTKDALNYTDELLNTKFSQAQKQTLLTSYKSLPAFSDVESGLQKLSKKYNLVALSNGENESVKSLLTNANIQDYFDDVVTADEIRTFKPDPKIYQHLLTRTNTEADACWLISSNPFDVIGSKSFGLNAAWIKRSEKEVFDSWGIEPNVVISDLNNFVSYLGL